MYATIAFQTCIVGCVFLCAMSHASTSGLHHSHDSVMASPRDEKSHIEYHMNGEISASNLNRMTEDELRFLYFKMHDSNQDNRLDGCELIKSLLHWHEEEHKAVGQDNAHLGTTRIFSNDELSLMIDPVLTTDDKNIDGFIDYPEFIAAQKSRGF